MIEIRRDYTRRMILSSTTRASARSSAATLLYGLLLLALGIIYRFTFIHDGFNATDEGYFQSLAGRIVAGDIPYRDFYWLRTPLTIYKEALFLLIFGHDYTLSCSRIIFTVEVSLCSVLAYVIIRRFTDPRSAFIFALPTIFFSVLLFYFSWYTYDGMFFLLLSVALLAYGEERRSLSSLAGVCACLAFLAKQNFLAFAAIVALGGIGGRFLARPGAATHPVQPRMFRDWPAFLLGFSVTLAAPLLYFASQGALSAFLRQVFVLPEVAFPEPRSYLLWQDLPHYLFAYPSPLHSIGLLIVVMLFLACITPRRLPAAPRVLILLAFATLDEGPYLLHASLDARRTFFIIATVCLLLALNALASVVSVLVHGPWGRSSPTRDYLRVRLFGPALPLCALALQYLSQYTYSGIILSYIGAFLSLPTALLFLSTLADLPHTGIPEGSMQRRSVAPRRQRQRQCHSGSPRAVWSLVQVAVPRWTALVLGAAIVGGSVAVLRATVYRDGPRSQLTAAFQTPRLAGITSLASNTRTIDALVAGMRCSTSPRERIFVFPDLAALYFLSSRYDATKIEWWTPPELTAAMVQEALATLQRHPPSLILLQRYDEADYLHKGPPLDYAAQPKWLPIYRYIVQAYTPIEDVGTILVLVPRRSSPAAMAGKRRCWGS